MDDLGKDCQYITTRLLTSILGLTKWKSGCVYVCLRCSELGLLQTKLRRLTKTSKSTSGELLFGVRVCRVCEQRRDHTFMFFDG